MRSPLTPKSPPIGWRIGDGVRDRAVVFVPRVERRDVVVAAFQDRAGKQLDPFGDDRTQVRVDDDQSLDLERGGHLEERPQGRALAADAVDLGIGQADAPQPVRRPDQQDLLHVAGRLGLDDDPLGAVGRARVGVDQDGPQLREVLDQPGLGGADDVTYRGRVPIARNADHDVGATEPGDLIGYRGNQGAGRHRGHRTTSRRRAAWPSSRRELASARARVARASRGRPSKRAILV